MQNEMNVDSLPQAIAYEIKAESIRRRSTSVQSDTSGGTYDSEIDFEIIVNDTNVSDSPTLPIRKRLS